ncbi:MAG TPA: hypothetical protein VLC47_08515 [Burkholderiales bacterium]|nr:hypothetical protein [Burkholderiales bacterium]
MLTRIFATAALVCATAAAAQTPAQPPREATAAPPPAYRSAYEGYRPYADEPLAPWREVNETVERVGGHAGVLRAGAGPSAAPGAAPAGEAKDRGHGGLERK